MYSLKFHSISSMWSGFSLSLLPAILLCSIFSHVPRLSTARFLGNETDRLTLLAFKSQIIQDPSNVMSSWNDSHHFCEWEGVACSHTHKRVTILNLSSKGLMGSISPHIGNLSFLMIIDLRNNSLGGAIPQELGYLRRLEGLSLSSNSLAGKIPVSVSRCSNLISVNLSRNNLIGRIPMELGSLSKLVDLVLDVNRLSGGIPPSLGNLTSLKTLEVSGNILSGSIPVTLAYLKNLKFLGLGENNFYGKLPPSLYNLSSLEIFSLTSNQLSGNLPNDIGLTLPNLQSFFIWENQFSGFIPNSLFNASRLQKVDLGKNEFTGHVPLNMGNLKELQWLGLGRNYLGSGESDDLNFFASLTNCSRLEFLGLCSNQFGGMLPASIANLSNHLNRLYMQNNQISGNIPAGIVNLHNLIILELSQNLLNDSIPMGIGGQWELQVLLLGENKLSGHIPSSIRNMSRLFHLDLSNNMLEGSIHISLEFPILKRLNLSFNNFTGAIPKREIGLSSQLNELDLGYNSLNGPIPMEVSNLKNLRFFAVAENKMSGDIPLALGSCLSLEELYFQGNFFQGQLPSSLTSLKNLQFLDVSRNNISGSIPKELEKLPYLKLLNLSYNNLDGEVPIQGIFQNSSAFSAFGNPRICGGIPRLGLNRCRIRETKKQGTHLAHLAMKVALGVIIPSFMIVVLLLIIFSSKKHKAKLPPEPFPGVLQRVSYHELNKATEGFSSANLIGIGNHGSVYKGIFNQEEDPVAVKVLNLMERGASKSFMVECEALGLRHRNLLKILTVCSSVNFKGDEFKAIVFIFMPNGSLEGWLHPSSDGQHLPESLNLSQRLNIAIDVASALDYLHNHCEKPIVHCDLKASNVLLDDDMTAHVGDFGLAKFLSKGTSSSSKSQTDSIAVRGTIGYIPPEYGMGAEVSIQGDLFSYGILLLEMFTGKRPTNPMFKDGLNIRDFSRMALPQRVLDIIDQSLLSEVTHNEAAYSMNKIKECLTSVIKIGIACSEEQLIKRMDIKDAMKELYSIKERLSSEVL